MAGFQEISLRIIENVEKVIIGKRPEVMTALAAVLAGGHVLLEDVPGVAKTMLARSLAITFGCSFKRVQCTPDLLPTDVTGVSVFNQKTLEFEFLRGPVFTHVLLADEINRATPRTQAALLEAMEEKQITVDGTTRRLADPFIVLATQNPVEQEGTFPLPEAQLDRFLVKLSLGYPNFDQESEMLDRLRGPHPLESLQPVVNDKVVVQMRESVAGVHVDPEIKKYILNLVHKTRTNLQLDLGASPRASIALYRTSQALAALNGREYVTADDVKALAVPVVGHRLILKPEHRLRKQTATGVIAEILNELEVPAGISTGSRPTDSTTAGKRPPDPLVSSAMQDKPFETDISTSSIRTVVDDSPMPVREELPAIPVKGRKKQETEHVVPDEMENAGGQGFERIDLPPFNSADEDPGKGA
jgi:MoxR-like ATPase